MRLCKKNFKNFYDHPMSISSVYIHIPFCSHKCLFCSFPIAVAQTHYADDYLNRLEKEAEHYQGAHLDTVYIGGGTPSLLSATQLGRLMQIVNKYFSLGNKCEITLEANPESMDQEKAKAIKQWGVNRISLGAQSFNDHYLKFLGRRHSTTQTKAAYALLRENGFDNINLDLMYAFPSQAAGELHTDVVAMASLGSEHLSLYTLTIEPQSRFYVQDLKLDDEEKIAQHYQEVTKILKGYGFQQYEISNFAKQGFQSRHNKNYWQGGEYIGLGMGAHGFMDNRRYWNTSKLHEYLHSIDAVAGFEELPHHTRMMERILFGLRMNEGIDTNLIPAGKQLSVDHFIREGFLIIDGQRLKATERGRLVLDELSSRLI